MLAEEEEKAEEEAWESENPWSRRDITPYTNTTIPTLTPHPGADTIVICTPRLTRTRTRTRTHMPLDLHIQRCMHLTFNHPLTISHTGMGAPRTPICMRFLSMRLRRIRR